MEANSERIKKESLSSQEGRKRRPGEGVREGEQAEETEEAKEKAGLKGLKRQRSVAFYEHFSI